MNVVMPSSPLNILIAVTICMAFFTVDSVRASHDETHLAPDMVAIADDFLGPHFKNIEAFCDEGILPWSKEVKSNVLEFVQMLYRSNWIVGVFNIHEMRMAAAFSDKNMKRFLSMTLNYYGNQNIHIFFYNINRCWSESKTPNQLFGNLRYILFHYYGEIDECLTSYHLTYARCELSNGYHYRYEEPIRNDMRELYETANGINQYFQDNDAQSIWLKQLQDIWLSTTTIREFREKKVLYDLPVVDIEFALQQVERLISHYAKLK